MYNLLPLLQKKIQLSLFVILSLLNINLYAQDIPVLRNVTKANKNNTRNTTGTPGKNYWQNRGDYTINVDFNPSTLKVQGKAAIIYTNNSPDTLKTLVFKLFPNFYKNNSMRNMIIAPEDLGTGININTITLDGTLYNESKKKIRGTTMYLPSVTILPGKKINIEIEYDYILNKGSFVRTGQIDPDSFFIAYFFPRVAVYDDVDGWDEYPYLGKEEFYNDYGNFNVSITVPGNFQVWGTGDLKNPDAVYDSHIIERIGRAEKGDKIVDIITPLDIKNQDITIKNKTNTWKFEALNVTDFAFGLSNNYVWQAKSVEVDSNTKRRTRIDAVFNPEHTSYNKVADYTAKTVELISNHFPKIPFPYSHQTVFDGLDAMEYPMMVNMLPFDNHNELLELTTHEVFHSIFPFYVGTNETKYSFMDEGWATFTEFYFSPMIDSSEPLNYDISSVNNSAGIAEDMPIITPTPQLYGKARFSNKDLKPALANFYLMELLGNQLFLKSVQGYIKNWAGKHPTPYDFFNSIESESKTDLKWFWKNWYFEKNVPDLAIAKVEKAKKNYTITISSPGTLMMPIHLMITYSDGSKETISKKIDCWKNGNKDVIISLPAQKTITQINLGDPYDVDINPADNVWKAK
ncbi:MULTISPECIES: M1 family metallopeptidase [Flavobacterium]|uniref:M1 family metallopeptidase n=1 Tax=Flavobacterium TaxID=237 RepID=UPI0021147029|nr:MULTISPECIES: M1 family metallopeptidase [Flavobacterium]UUF12929.1 M1 family metallopeptidase [Flavobacterium panici]